MFLASLLPLTSPQIYNRCTPNINFAILFNNFMIVLHCAFPLFSIDKISYILDISTLKHYPLPFRFVTSYAKGEIKVLFCISFLPSLNTQIACSVKRGQTNRRIPFTNKNEQEAHCQRGSPEK